jgi:hypothetical protein
VSELGEALAAAGHMVATDSRDWGLDPTDAWLYGLLCGWDDEEDPGAAMAEVAKRHGWTAATVASLRRCRAAIQRAQEERSPE